MKQKRVILELVDVLEEALKYEDSKEKIKEILTEEQYMYLKKLITDNLNKDERWVAYKQGFMAAEIGRATNYTRANISARIKDQLVGKEDISDEHKENRERLFYARDWYIFVYKSDKVGDYMQAAKYVGKSSRTKRYLYWKYKNLGGTELEKDFKDRRRVLDEEKINRIIEGLKEYSFEQVAFQERIHPDSMKKIIKENNLDVFYEKDTGESFYTEKLNTWLEKKQELNSKQYRKMSKEVKDKKDDR